VIWILIGDPVVGLENDLCRGPDLDLYYDLDLKPDILLIFHVTWICHELLDPYLLSEIELIDLRHDLLDLHHDLLVLVHDLLDLRRGGHLDLRGRRDGHGLLCLDCLGSDLDGRLSCLLCIHY
jgi:hypothetical protein